MEFKCEEQPNSSNFAIWLPSSRLLKMVVSIGDSTRFVMAIIQFFVGMLNIWVPELNSLVQMEKYDDDTHND